MPGVSVSIILSFALSLFVTTALLPTCRRYAGTIGLLDSDAAGRKIHEGEIPRSGGIAIVAGALLTILMWLPDGSNLLPMIGCASIIVAFGLADDIWDLRPRYKLAGQLIAAVLFLAIYGGLTRLPFFPIDEAPMFLAMLISLVFVVGITNAVNLSDGLDGLAAGNSLLHRLFRCVSKNDVGSLATQFQRNAFQRIGGILGDCSSGPS